VNIRGTCQDPGNWAYSVCWVLLVRHCGGNDVIDPYIADLQTRWPSVRVYGGQPGLTDQSKERIGDIFEASLALAREKDWKAEHPQVQPSKQKKKKQKTKKGANQQAKGKKKVQPTHVRKFHDDMHTLILSVKRLLTAVRSHLRFSSESPSVVQMSSACIWAMDAFNIQVPASASGVRKEQLRRQSLPGVYLSRI
jgi:hypothetical protein